MANDNEIKDYEQEGYLSLWLCNTESIDSLNKYLEIDYGNDEEDLGIDDVYTVDFEMGHDFNIKWYDEDYLEASHSGNMKGWDLLEGHSYIESIFPALRESCQDVMSDTYNSVIIIYDFKYDGSIKEVKNARYGFFKYIGAFEYSINR